MFEKRHPEHDRWSSRWQKAHDFYRGGLHVVAPALAVSSVRFYRAVGSVESEDDVSYVYSPKNSASYLWSFTRESEDSWRDRNDRATHFPIVRPLTGILSSSIFRSPPSRRMPGDNQRDLPDEWKAYLKNADLTGRTMDAVSNGIVRWGLVFGKCFGVTDVPNPDNPPTTMREQKAQGIRPYTYAITPLELEDWALDEYGDFVWARLAEVEVDDRGPLQDPAERSPQYRIWTREGWQVWRRTRTKTGALTKNGKWALEQSGPGPGVVPIQPFFADRTESRASHDSDTPLASHLDIDVEVFNLFSLLNEQEFASTFPQLVVEDDGSMGDVEVGPASAIVYPQGGQRPDYIGPNPGIAAGLFDRISARLDMAKNSSTTNRGAADWSKEERSASALDVEYQDRYAMLSGLAASAEDFEDGVFSHVAAWTGETEWPESRYGRRFDMRNVSQQINDSLNVNSLPIPDAVKGLINSELVDRLLKEMGVPDNARRAAVSDVKEAGEELQPTKQGQPPAKDGANG